jgi:hypothetical protein
MQVGGDEFWTNGKIGVHSTTQKNLELWETNVGTERIVAAYNGAPRLWSHGLRQISEQKATQLVHAWGKTLDITDRAEQIIAQRNIARDAVEELQLVSKTFMVDAYREVMCGVVLWLVFT